MIKKLAAILDRPVVIFDTTTLTPSGYHGNSTDAILNELLAKADGDVDKASHGIVYLDEWDKAFIGASAADDYGNCTGQTGPNACGALGYSFVDAHNAGCVIVITDNLVEYPCVPASISQQYVDYVVKVDAIGDPKKIGAGAARLTKNPRDLRGP